ncbi:MAG: glycerol-3-phosphate acyltransferase [Clostridia bacterium]
MNVRYAMFIIAGFLSGGVLYSRFLPHLFKNIDISEMSADKNPGSSNAIKYAGVKLGLICLLFDIAKGFAPVWLAKNCLDTNSLLFSLILLAPVFGHAFSPFKKGKGGKAVATSFGVLLAVITKTNAIFFLIALYFLFLLLPIRPNEKKTVFAFFILAFLQWFSYDPLSLKMGGTFISLTVILKNFKDAFFQGEKRL